jgi:hypothetical protein
MAGAPDPGPWSGPAFEAVVYQELQKELLDYCERARRDPRVDPARMRVRVLVVTGSPLGRCQEQLRALAEQIVEGELRRAVLEPVAFALERGIGAPGYWFGIEPQLPGDVTDPGGGRHPWVRSDPWVPTGRDATAPWSPAAAGRDRRHPARAGTFLVVTFDRKVAYGYPLDPADEWIQIGRQVASGPGRPAIRLPDFLTVVPRGALLELRYQLDRLELRRSRERAEYDVWVDGARLPPGQVTDIGPAAGIRYALGSRLESVLGFELRERD